MKVKEIAIAIGLMLASAVAAHGQNLAVGSMAPPIKVGGWAKGTPVTKLDPKRMYVVEFWATWCQPCKVSTPHLTELAKAYKGKVTFIGVSVWEQGANIPKQVRQFVASEGAAMNYNVAYDTTSGTMSKTWMTAAKQDGIPSAFVIAHNKIQWIGLPMQGLQEALGGIVAGVDPVKVKAIVEAKEKAEQASLQKLFADYQTAAEAKKPREFLHEVAQFQAEHPNLASSADMVKFGPLLAVDRRKGLEFIDAKLEKDFSFAMVVENAFIQGGGFVEKDPELAVHYAKKVDSSKSGKNFYSKMFLVSAYDANDQKAQAMTAAKAAIKFAPRDGAPQNFVDGLKSYVSHYGEAFLLVGDPAPTINVGGWVQGTPVRQLEPDKVYVIQFFSADIATNEDLGWVAKKYKGKVSCVSFDVREDSANLEDTAKGIISKDGDQLGYTALAYDTSDGAMKKGWLEASNQRGLPCVFIVAKGRIVCRSFYFPEDKSAKILDQILDGTFDVAKSRLQDAVNLVEADLLYKIINNSVTPQQKLAILEEFDARFPSFAEDDEICDLKVGVLLDIDKSKGLAFADSHGPKYPYLYSEVVGHFLRLDHRSITDCNTALVYAKKYDESSHGSSSSAKEDVGDAYSATGEKSLAKSAYELGLTLAKKDNDPKMVEEIQLRIKNLAGGK